MNFVRWFGKSYPAPIYSDCHSTPTPVGSACMHCEEIIIEGDDGFLDSLDNVFHRACFLRGIVGSVAHQLRLCSCHTPHALDPATNLLTKREEATAAVSFWEGTQGL